MTIKLSPSKLSPSTLASTVHAPDAVPEPGLFREAMSRVAGAVHIIATDGPGGKGGLTATAVTTVSDSPPSLLVCLNKSSRTLTMLRENGRFSVNTLRADQHEIADIFAGRAPGDGPAIDGLARFDHGTWQSGVDGQPLLVDSLIAFSVVVQEIKPVASHLVVIGQITAIRLGEAMPGLVYARRGYHRV